MLSLFCYTKSYFRLILLFVLSTAGTNSYCQGFPYEQIELVSLNDFTAGSNWKIVGDVFYDVNGVEKNKTTKGTGVVVNEITEKDKAHLFTKMQHGDIQLELDFMMAKNSNAGVYLQGRYEVQMFDSWGVEHPKSTDCGAIYERWDESKPEGRKGYEGHPPASNVSRAPGLWQHYKIVFRAPRFDAQGAKIENAKFVLVEHNGVVVQENVEVTGSTRAAPFNDEQPLGPLMIQGDHGPVAIKNIKYKRFSDKAVALSNMKLDAYEGQFHAVSDLDSKVPSQKMAVDLIEHQGTETNDHFGGKISGTIHLPTSGKYFFHLNLKWVPDDTNVASPNGGGAFTINNKLVTSLDGKHGGNVSCYVYLDSGQYPFEIKYYKTYPLWYARSNDIELGVETPEIKYSILNGVLRSADAVGAITIPVDGEPVMQRSFINHHGVKKTHVISVGEPGAANYTVDLKTGGFLQFWRGNFIETTKMWHERGEQQLAEPLGSVIVLSGKPSFATLNNQNSAWPDSLTDYTYKGYDVTTAGHPVFKYSIGKMNVRDGFETESNGKNLIHSFQVTDASKNMWCLIGEGDSIVQLPNGLYAVNGKDYLIEVAGAFKPIIRKTEKNTFQLLTPLSEGSSVIKYSLIW